MAKYFSIFMMMSEFADNKGVVLITMLQKMLYKHRGVPSISGTALTRNTAGIVVTTIRSVADKTMIEK